MSAWRWWSRWRLTHPRLLAFVGYVLLILAMPLFQVGLEQLARWATR